MNITIIVFITYNKCIFYINNSKALYNCAIIYNNKRTLGTMSHVSAEELTLPKSFEKKREE